MFVPIFKKKNFRTSVDTILSVWPENRTHPHNHNRTHPHNHSSAKCDVGDQIVYDLYCISSGSLK